MDIHILYMKFEEVKKLGKSRINNSLKGIISKVTNNARTKS